MIIRLHLYPPQTTKFRASIDLSHEPAKNPKPKPLPSYQAPLHTRTLLTPRPTSTTTSQTLQQTSDSGLLFREKILYLQALKVNPAKVLAKNPDFRVTPLESLKSVEKCLSSMGIERSAFGRIFDMNPKLLSCDPDSDLYPVLDFLLNEVNLPFPDIRKSILRCPRLLVCSVDDQLRPTLRFLENLGFVGSHAISCQTTVLLVSSVEGTFVPKLNYLQEVGFSYEEVATMVLRSPALLTYSVPNNLRPKVEYFLEEMKGNLVELKWFPQYFSFSLEKKIRPRHLLLVESGLALSLHNMLINCDGAFEYQLIDMKLRLVEGIKLNTDGSCHGPHGPGGFGGVFRDATGAWIHGYHGHLETCTPLEAGLWGIYCGLTVILRKGLRDVVIESDCMDAVEVIKETPRDDSNLKYMVIASQRILSLSGSSLKHVRRDSNKCADAMAKLGAQQPEKLLICKEPPAEVRSLLASDLIKLSWQRA